jgi:DNA-directed RNA polymerase beta subunit
MNSKNSKIGSYIQAYEYPWWQVAFEGKIMVVEATRNGAIRVHLEYIGLPVNGDKFTMLHGQKGVATILSDEDKPHVRLPNGSYRAAEIVIGSSAIIRRGTPSQLLEAAASMFSIRSDLELG